MNTGTSFFTYTASTCTFHTLKKNVQVKLVPSVISYVFLPLAIPTSRLSLSAARSLWHTAASIIREGLYHICDAVHQRGSDLEREASSFFCWSWDQAWVSGAATGWLSGSAVAANTPCLLNIVEGSSEISGGSSSGTKGAGQHWVRNRVRRWPATRVSIFITKIISGSESGQKGNLLCLQNKIHSVFGMIHTSPSSPSISLRYKMLMYLSRF